MVKGAVDCLGGPRQACHCESHLTCELPFPMAGTILSTSFCSGGQRFPGTTIFWVDGWGQDQGREGEGRIEEALKFQSMLEQGQRKVAEA